MCNSNEYFCSCITKQVVTNEREREEEIGYLWGKKPQWKYISPPILKIWHFDPYLLKARETGKEHLLCCLTVRPFSCGLSVCRLGCECNLWWMWSHPLPLLISLQSHGCSCEGVVWGSCRIWHWLHEVKGWALLWNSPFSHCAALQEGHKCRESPLPWLPQTCIFVSH